LVGSASRLTSSSSGRESSRAGDFLLLVVGVNPGYITDDVSERRWYHSMGLAMLMVAVFAFIGAATTLSFRFTDPRTWVVGGLVWAVAVFIVDRGITSYVERYPTFWRKVATMIPRVALAVLAAVAVSESLVLILLDNEIKQQLVIMNAQGSAERHAAATQAEQPALDQITGTNGKVDRLTADLKQYKADSDRAQLKVTCETAGGHPPECAGVATTGVAGSGRLVTDRLEPDAAKAAGDAATAQRAYDAYLVDLQPPKLTDAQMTACGYSWGELLTQEAQDLCTVTARIEAAAAVSSDTTEHVVLNRVIAVFEIGKPGSPQRLGSHVVHGVLFGLFLFFDLIPLIMKFSRGPTGHDEASRAAVPPFIPRFDDRRLKQSMWADRGIGTDAMAAARRHSASFYERLYEKQSEYALARERAAYPPPPAPADTSAGRPAGPAGTEPFPGPDPAAADPRTGGKRQSREGDNLDEASGQHERGVLVVGATLGGQFRLVQSLGDRGQQYAIYRVRDLFAGGGAVHEFVAKIALDDRETEYGYQGLVREVAAGGEPQHPHIVPALSGVRRDETYGVAYRIMPFYPGGHLGTWNATNPQRTLAQMFEIGDGILNGLEEGHRRGNTHLDIKPENILMQDTGPHPHPVVGDWGNGKALYRFKGPPTAQLRGTPDYCAPEQLTRRSKGPDRRGFASDLYSFAALMYDFVEEASPRQRAAERAGIDTDSPDYWRFIQDKNQVMPRLAGVTPPRLAELIHRWLAFEPEDRLPGGHPPGAEQPGNVQAISLARRELAEVFRTLSPDQLAMPVRRMATGSEQSRVHTAQKTQQ
jgi:serine/threonine protein kinase